MKGHTNSSNWSAMPFGYCTLRGLQTRSSRPLSTSPGEVNVAQQYSLAWPRNC